MSSGYCKLTVLMNSQLKDTIQLHFPVQVHLRTPEHPSPTYTESLSGRDVLERSPVNLKDVDLATQCVDSTLLLLDSSAGHREDDTAPDPKTQPTQQLPDILNAQLHDFGDNNKQDGKGSSRQSHANGLLQTLAHYGLRMVFF